VSFFVSFHFFFCLFTLQQIEQLAFNCFFFSCSLAPLGKSLYLHTSTRPSAHPTRSRRAAGIRATPATRREEEDEEEAEEELPLPPPPPLPLPLGATTRTLASKPAATDDGGGSAAIQGPP
jgi:hypothetical protein